MGDTLFYCGFNGFKQVPNQSSQTLSTLLPHSFSNGGNDVVIRDVAVCWNYLAVVDGDGVVTKFGLVNNGRNGVDRLQAPPPAAATAAAAAAATQSGPAVTPPAAPQRVTQLSATPRHLMVCTEEGECWTHEESKGWRRVAVGTEKAAPVEQEKEAKAAAAAATAEDKDLIDLKANDTSEAKSSPEKEEVARPSSEKENGGGGGGDGGGDSDVFMSMTSCGDAHNLGLDSAGQAYSLPSPLEFDTFPSDTRHKVTQVVCGKEHCLLLTEHGQVFSWGGGSRGQLGHGSLASEEHPRLVQALDGLRARKVEAGGWHSAVVSQFDDLYMFGWNESGQLAQPTNLVRPAECFAAVEKLLMACCTMQPEDDAANPRADPEDCEVYHKNSRGGGGGSGGGSGEGGDPRVASEPSAELEKDSTTCYNAATACNEDATDLVVVQSLPMLVQIPASSLSSSSAESKVVDVGCGSRHTVVLTAGNELWGFGWNKYGQLGLGNLLARDSVQKVPLPKAVTARSRVKMLRCGDWGTVLVVNNNNNNAGGGGNGNGRGDGGNGGGSGGGGGKKK